MFCALEVKDNNCLLVPGSDEERERWKEKGERENCLLSTSNTQRKREESGKKDLY